MSFALYKSMMKSAATSILSYAVGSILYEWLIAWVYPTIAGNSKMNELLRQMPANLLKAFDLEKGVKSFGDYLAGEFFKPVDILNGTLEPASYIFGLGLAALVLFIIATVIFQTRDLSV